MSMEKEKQPSEKKPFSLSTEKRDQRYHSPAKIDKPRSKKPALHLRTQKKKLRRKEKRKGILRPQMQTGMEVDGLSHGGKSYEGRKKAPLRRRDKRSLENCLPPAQKDNRHLEKKKGPLHFKGGVNGLIFY